MLLFLGGQFFFFGRYILLYQYYYTQYYYPLIFRGLELRIFRGQEIGFSEV